MRLTERSVYDQRGNLLEQTGFPEVCVGGTNRGGACLSHTDCPVSSCGITTRTTYDVRDNVSTTTDPAGNTWSFLHDVQGNLISERDPLGHETTHGYVRPPWQQPALPGEEERSAPRPAATTNPRGYVSSCEYVTGQLWSATGPLGGTVQHAYDLLGRRNSTTDPLGSAGVPDHTACVEYSDEGLIVAQSFLCNPFC